MNKGIEIHGEAGARTLSFNGVVIAYGGSGTDGLHADGHDLILDGAVIATSTEDPNLGLYAKDGVMMFGDAVVGNDEQEEQTYPQGVTQIATVAPQGAYVNYPAGWPSVNGTKQGAAIYGDLWFQFYNGGHVVVQDILNNAKVKEFNIPIGIWPWLQGDEAGNEPYHCSCAQFSNEKENTGDTWPLVYITASGYTCVINLNHSVESDIHLVRWWHVDNNVDGDTVLPAHASVAAFDFANGIGYSIGYPQGIGTGSVNHTNGGKFEIIPYTFPQSGSGDVTSSIVMDAANKVILDKTQNVTYINSMVEGKDADWSNIQDADFKNGHIYILYGGVNGGNNRPKIIDYVPMQSFANAMFTNITKDNTDGLGVEGEGMAKYKNGWIVSSLYSSEKIFVI